MPTLRLRAKGRVYGVEYEAVDDDRLAFTTPFAFKDELKAMVGAKWSADTRQWVVADVRRNWIQLEYLQGLTPPEHTSYDPRGHYPPVDPRRECLAHQPGMLGHAVGAKRSVLAAEMGTGKTFVGIEFMERNPGEWWWVAPPRTHMAVALELVKWKSRVSPKLLSYEKMRSILENWRPGDPPPKGVVFDESSRLKRATAQRTVAAQHLADAMRTHWGDAACLLLLTGTPAPHDPCDWWPQAEIACPGWLRESSQAQLRKRLAEILTVDPVTKARLPFPKLIGWKQKEVDLLAKRLAGVVYVCRQEDTELHLPLPRREMVQLEVSPETARAAWLVAQTSQGAQVLNRLRQLSDGFLYEDGETRRAGTPKDQALKDLLERYEEAGRFITFAGYTESIDRCTALCVEAGWQVMRMDSRGTHLITPPGCDGYEDTQAAMLAMQRAGDPDDKLCVVGHPGSGGFGQNWQGSPAICFYSNDFNAESRLQAEARNRRPGMDVRRGTVIYDLVHLGTDRYVLERLQQRRDVQAATLADLREYLVAA